MVFEPTDLRISGAADPHPPGASARWIGQLLERENLIHNAHVFAWTVRFKGLGHQLKAGTYQLDGTGTTAAIAQSLLKAPIQTQPATIPEGLNRHQIAGHLQAAGVADSSRFIAATEDPRLIRQLGVAAPSLEGYLFPETYFFDLNVDERTIATLMVDQFHRVFADSLHQQLAELGLSLHQAVTLASIVEREAVAVEEQPIISGVFQRRLKLNRRLESCATINYALGSNKKRLTYADLEIDSPFNTYRHHGLPPAPSATPAARPSSPCSTPRKPSISTLSPAATAPTSSAAPTGNTSAPSAKSSDPSACRPTEDVHTRRPQSSATPRSRGRGRPAIDSRRGRLGQDPCTHPSHRFPHRRSRRAPVAYSRRDLHQQGCGRNARAHRAARWAGGHRTMDRYLPLDLCAHPAPPGRGLWFRSQLLHLR